MGAGGGYDRCCMYSIEYACLYSEDLYRVLCILSVMLFLCVYMSSAVFDVFFVLFLCFREIPGAFVTSTHASETMSALRSNDRFRDASANG